MKPLTTQLAASRAKVISIDRNRPQPPPEVDQWSRLTRVLLAVILVILFLAFMVTTPPMIGPEPCPPPQRGWWPQCR